MTKLSIVGGHLEIDGRPVPANATLTLKPEVLVGLVGSGWRSAALWGAQSMIAANEPFHDEIVRRFEALAAERDGLKAADARRRALPPDPRYVKPKP